MAPLWALLAWQECAGLEHSAPAPSRLFASLCALAGSKGGKVQRVEVSGSREECGGHGCECPLLDSPAVLPAPCPLYLGFVGAVSLARNTHEKPLIRRRLDRRRSRLRAVQAALCREHLGGK